MSKLNHLDSDGKINMVDVSGKGITTRTASASATVITGQKIFQAVKQNTLKKGDVLTTAKIAGINAAKKTSELIPLCHNISLSMVDIQFRLNSRNNSIEIISRVNSASETGVEVEALTSVTIAALTVYDMCKSMSKSIVISGIHLISKSGGKSGEYNKDRRSNGK